ncbi:MAG: type II secretion system protein [Actinomycetota bacterium]|nr:type II secretion system GspH family protein [Actinomycetota bacterium]
MRRYQRDDGLTLVELIVTVSILGIAFLAVVGGMTTSILASDIHRKESTAGAALRSYAEVVKTTAYSNCSTNYSPAYTPPANFTPTITGIKYWNDATGTWLALCAADSGIQLVSLQVTSSDSRAVETLDVVKRRP